MTNTIKFLLAKFISGLLLIALLFPFALELDHLFQNHEHFVCNSKNNKHFHENELDCELYNYKNNTLKYVSTVDYNKPQKKVLANNAQTISSFLFQENFSSFYLRGPPSCV